MALEVSDFTIRLNGALYAVCNAVLVAGMCTYERYLMTSANLGMSAIDINFHRVVSGLISRSKQWKRGQNRSK